MELKINDLHNPDKIIAILHNNGKLIECDIGDQGWQETKGRYELWQKMENGQLLCIKAWNKKSVIATYF